jgi:hypothetical protein
MSGHLDNLSTGSEVTVVGYGPSNERLPRVSPGRLRKLKMMPPLRPVDVLTADGLVLRAVAETGVRQVAGVDCIHVRGVGATPLPRVREAGGWFAMGAPGSPARIVHLAFPGAEEWRHHHSSAKLVLWLGTECGMVVPEGSAHRPDPRETKPRRGMVTCDRCKRAERARRHEGGSDGTQ